MTIIFTAMTNLNFYEPILSEQLIIVWRNGCNVVWIVLTFNWVLGITKVTTKPTEIVLEPD